MVPGCVVVGNGGAQRLAVTVASAATTTDPAVPSSTPGAPTITQSASGVPGGASVPAPTSLSPTGSTALVPAGTQIPLPTTGTTVTLAPFGGSAVIAASPVELDGGHSSKGVRMLAVVAAICLLGVTAAIIRSIVRLSP
jgi:hypothetical protein